MNAVKETVTEEIQKVEYTSKELKDIYNKAQKKAKNIEVSIQVEFNYKNKELEKITNDISKLYDKKIKKEISVDEFKELYQKMIEKKENIKKELDNIKLEIEQNKNKEIERKKSEYKKIENTAKKFLKMENPDNEILKRLVKKIVFDKNKNIKVELTFSSI